MIEDVEEQDPHAAGTATGTDVIAVAMAAVLGAAIVAGFAVITIPDPRVVPLEGRDVAPDPTLAGPPPCAATRSPMETVYRMFDLTIATTTEILSSCWTPGRAPAAGELATYMHARRPLSLTVASVIQRYDGGQLFAELHMRATWRTASAPSGWANDEPRLVTLRQQPTGAWTIDEVRAP